MSAILEELSALLAARQAQPTPDSYSARLVADPLRAAQKVGEEGVEVVIAALAQDRARLISESADLVFHLLALLQARDVRWSEVEAELRRRRHPEDGQP